MFAALLWLTGTAHAADPPRLITREGWAAADAASDWLAAHQNPDGSWGENPRYRGNVAVTGLCGLALAAGGSTPAGGPHAGAVSRAAGYLLGRVREDGLILDVSGSRSAGTAMYGHGFALLFLCEVAGELPEPAFDPAAVRAVLSRAVGRTVASQTRAGGWRYSPTSADSDLSVTTCQIAALRSARDFGLDVPAETVAAAVKYVRRCRNPADGGFFYQADRRDRSAFARTAAAIASLQTAGADVDGDEADEVAREVAAGLAHLLRTRPTAPRGDRLYAPYGRFYATRAAWRAGGETWSRWYPRMRDDLLRKARVGENATIYWPDATVGPAYATAMHTLALRVPQNLLPLFAR